MSRLPLEIVGYTSTRRMQCIRYKPREFYPDVTAAAESNRTRNRYVRRSQEVEKSDAGGGQYSLLDFTLQAGKSTCSSTYKGARATSTSSPSQKMAKSSQFPTRSHKLYCPQPMISGTERLTRRYSLVLISCYGRAGTGPTSSLTQERLTMKKTKRILLPGPSCLSRRDDCRTSHFI